jgi:hypothetical protein
VAAGKPWQAAGISRKTWYKHQTMTTNSGQLADLNQLWPADHNATPRVATPDGSWTRYARLRRQPGQPAAAKRGAPGRACYAAISALMRCTVPVPTPHRAPGQCGSNRLTMLTGCYRRGVL